MKQWMGKVPSDGIVNRRCAEEKKRKKKDAGRKSKWNENSYRS